MKIEDIQKAIWLQENLENVQEALKASSILCIVPDCCGFNKVELSNEAKRIVKRALREYGEKIETEIKKL